MTSNKKTASEWLAPHRQRIDEIDNEIIDLLGERFKIVRDVGNLKTKEGIVIEQTDRVEEVKRRNAKHAAKYGFPPELIHTIFGLLIDHAHDVEHAIKKEQEGQD
jgi:chorismate mutase